jgi:hypothetical protein
MDASSTYSEDPPVAVRFTLSGPTTGYTGIASTFYVTPDAALGSAVVVSIAAPGAALNTTTLSFLQGSSAAQPFTVTRSTDGTTSVSITNNGGLTNSGTPIAFTSSPQSVAISTATVQSTGTQIYLTFSQIVSVGSGGSGGFVLSMSGGASAMTYSSGSGSTTLVYSLGRIINVGETGTLAYTQPGNGIEATTGGADVASFSGAAVTNNVTGSADWTTRSTTGRVTHAQNWASFTDAAAAYAAPGVAAANKNPSMGSTFTNAFELVTDAGHMASGKALRLWHGKNNYGDSGEIDNQWWCEVFNGDKNNLAGAFLRKVYVQVTVWADAHWNYKWLLGDGTQGGAKIFILDTTGTSSEGELVIHNYKNQGFVDGYRRTAITDESARSITRQRSGTGLSGNPDYQMQNAIDAGTPSSPNTASQWEQRYGPFNYTSSTDGANQTVPLSSQNIPDADALVAGVPLLRSGRTTITVELDLYADRARVWASNNDGAPKLTHDTIYDNAIGSAGGADFGSRVKTSPVAGVGWSGITIGNLINTADGAHNPNYPTDAYMDYSELIVSRDYIDFPGGHTPPGISTLAQTARGMASGSWATFTMGGLNLSLVDSTNGQSVLEYAGPGQWDPVHKKIQFVGHGHQTTVHKLLTWDDATNQWSASTSDTPWPSESIGHAYYHMTCDQKTGDLYMRKYDSVNVSKRAWGGSWTEIDTIADIANQDASCMEWFPELNSGAGGLIYADALRAEAWNPSPSPSGNWSELTPALSGLSNSPWIAYAMGYVWFGQGTKVYRVTSGGTVTTNSAWNTPVSAGCTNGAARVLASPDRDYLLLFGDGATTGAIYKFDGSTWSSYGTHQIGGPPNLYFGTPIFDYGVMIFVSQTSSNGAPVAKVYKP